MLAPRVIVTGASGFVGRHLLEHLKADYRIVGIARRSQRRAGVPDDANITWLEADIAERPQLEAVSRTIAETGGADYVIRPFERTWMAAYIDREMRVDSSVTRRLLNWNPRPRLGLLRRVPFIVENLKTDPHEWIARNQAAMKAVWLSDYLKIYWLLQKHEPEILESFHDALTGPDRQQRFPTYQRFAEAEHDWNHRLIVRQLFNAVRTGDKSVFTTYCRDLAVRRFNEGFEAEEFCGAVELLNLICMRILRRDPASDGMRQQILDYITMTLRFGCDQAQETFEELSMRGPGRAPERQNETWRDQPASTSSRPTAGISNGRSG